MRSVSLLLCAEGSSHFGCGAPVDRNMSSKQLLPPDLVGNHCHIAPEWEGGAGQRLWFVNAPYGGTVLRFRGEPTSLLYAIAPLVNEIRLGRVPGLTISDIAILNPPIASSELYAE